MSPFENHSNAKVECGTNFVLWDKYVTSILRDFGADAVREFFSWALREFTNSDLRMFQLKFAEFEEEQNNFKSSKELFFASAGLKEEFEPKTKKQKSEVSHSTMNFDDTNFLEASVIYPFIHYLKRHEGNDFAVEILNFAVEKTEGKLKEFYCLVLKRIRESEKILPNDKAEILELLRKVDADCQIENVQSAIQLLQRISKFSSHFDNDAISSAYMLFGTLLKFKVEEKTELNILTILEDFLISCGPNENFSW